MLREITSTPKLKPTETIFANSLGSSSREDLAPRKRKRVAGKNKFKWGLKDADGNIVKVYDVRRDAMANSGKRRIGPQPGDPPSLSVVKLPLDYKE